MLRLAQEERLHKSCQVLAKFVCGRSIGVTLKHIASLPCIVLALKGEGWSLDVFARPLRQDALLRVRLMSCNASCVEACSRGLLELVHIAHVAAILWCAVFVEEKTRIWHASDFRRTSRSVLDGISPMIAMQKKWPTLLQNNPTQQRPWLCSSPDRREETLSQRQGWLGHDNAEWFRSHSPAFPCLH